MLDYDQIGKRVRWLGHADGKDSITYKGKTVQKKGDVAVVVQAPRFVLYTTMFKVEFSDGTVYGWTPVSEWEDE